MGQPHRIGIVGLGVISEAYLKTLAAHPGIRVTAVADLDARRAGDVAARLGATALEVEALVEHPAVDTVLNLTTPAAHAAIARAALAAGKRVYGEKPLATTLEDGRALLEAAGGGGARIGSAPDTVLGTGTQTARAAIDDGLIGRPLAASATLITPGHERWHSNPDFYYLPGGGPLFDMGPYYITALVHLLGPITAVTGATSRLRASRTILTGPRAGEVIPVEVDTHVSAVLEHAGGALSTLVTSFDGVATSAPHIEVHGTLGSLVAPNPNNFDGDVLLRSLGEPDWQAVPVSAGYVDASRGVGLLDFVAATPERPARACGMLALHVLDVMSGVLASALAGRRVALATTAVRPPPVPLTAEADWSSEHFRVACRDQT